MLHQYVFDSNRQNDLMLLCKLLFQAMSNFLNQCVMKDVYDQLETYQLI